MQIYARLRVVAVGITSLYNRQPVTQQPGNYLTAPRIAPTSSAISSGVL